MINQLTSLLDASFGVRYFLPSLLLLLGGSFIHDLLTGNNEIFIMLTNATSRAEALAGSAFVGLVAWVVGVAISAVQFEFIRILEGYGKLNPLRIFHNTQIRQFKRLSLESKSLNNTILSWRSAHLLEDPVYIARWKTLERILATRYPSKETDLLPTSFGNALRSYERYPNQMYGIDGITGWIRLIAVIPPEYLALIGKQELYRDFWVNMSFIGFFLLAETTFIVLSRPLKPCLSLGIAGLLVLFIVIAYLRAIAFACIYGNCFKAAFDLYLDDLRIKLGVPKVSDPEHQRFLWNKVSQAFTYTSPEELDLVHVNHK